MKDYRYKLIIYLWNKIYLATNLDFLNTESATFRNANREIIDITLATRTTMWRAITGWRVSDEISMSDHNHTVFEIIGRSTEIRGRRSRLPV